MDVSAKKQIKKGLLEFQQQIRFRTYDNPQTLIDAVIQETPALTYYMNSYTIVSSLNNYELRPQYIHKEISHSNIHVVLSSEECLNIISQHVGDYKERLIILAHQSLNLTNVTTEFNERFASFYPNLTRIGVCSYCSEYDHSVYEFTFDYRIGQVKLKMMEQEVDNEVKRLTKLLFLPSMPSEVKIYLAHNYLASTITYKNNNKNNLDASYSQSAYGALIKKQCVCQGYAEAFKRLMNAANIECEVIYGKCSGSSIFHAWNIVSLEKNNSYYHIDVTWDSTTGHPGYLYFCKSDKFFIGKREWNKKYCHACLVESDVLSSAKKYVYQNKKTLLNHGIDERVIDC